MSSNKQIIINKLNERINELINTNEELDNFKRMALRDIRLLKQQLNETLDLLEECNSSRSSRHIIKRIEAIESNLDFLKSQLNLIDDEHKNNISEIKQIDTNIISNTPKVISNIPAMPIIIPPSPNLESNVSNKSNKLKNNVLPLSNVNNNLSSIDNIIQVPVTSQSIQQLPNTLETTTLQPKTESMQKVSNKQKSNKQISNKKSEDNIEEEEEENEIVEINITGNKNQCQKGEYFDKKEQICKKMPQCPTGQYFNKKENMCKVIPQCPPGERFIVKKGKCLPKNQNPNQKK
jgi:hypothetical protein